MAFYFTKLFPRFSKRAKALTGGDPVAVRCYSDRVLATPVETLLEPSLYRRPDGPDVIDLNLAAPRFESPVSIGRLTADRLGPPPGWGLPELREAVATRIEYDAENVLVTRGASGAFAAVLDAFVNPGEPVVLFDPCSPLFSLGAANRRARIRYAPATWDRVKFRMAVCDAKLVVLSVPNNPTGGVHSPDELRELVYDTAKAGAILYFDASFDPEANLPTGNRILRAGSVSPIGLGGLRVGWLAGSPGLLRPCALAQVMGGPFVPTVCQQVAVRAVEDRESWASLRDAIATRRAWVSDRLDTLGFATAPGSGLFLWVNIAGLKLTGRQFADRLLEESNVIVGPGDLFGPSGQDFVRVSVAADDGRVREGLSRIEAFVATVTGKPRLVSTRVPMEAKVIEREPAFSRI